MELVYDYKEGSGIFIQVGAGAGDLDERAGNHDGFTEFIKSLPRDRIKQICLVEPNPINIPSLTKCWAEFPEATIHQIAIVPETMRGKSLEIFYCPEDAPHYQIASINLAHVKKHYGESCEIRSFQIETKTIREFIQETVKGKIELLALDIEGIDADVLLDLKLDELPVRFISFEHLHLGEKKNLVWKHFMKHNFIFRGRGCDHNGFDSLFEKLKSPGDSI